MSDNTSVATELTLETAVAENERQDREIDDLREECTALRLYGEEKDAQLTAAQERERKMRDVLKPFAHYFDLNDCQHMRDDNALEIPIGDLRRAAATIEDAP